MTRRMLIAHNRLQENPSEDEMDVIAQVEAVRGSLFRLGWDTDTMSLTLDLDTVREAIASFAPDCIFNLVESLGGEDRFISAAALCFESLHLPFTGSSSVALAATSNKLSAKNFIAAAGIPTPVWTPVTGGLPVPGFLPVIMKSVTDHASIGISDDSIITSGEQWRRWLKRHEPLRPGEWFAEAFVDGREFNLSLLQKEGGGVRILPVAEICFSSFPAGKPRIVGYEAKWSEDSYEYLHTPRIFPDDPDDALLLERLRSLAVSCWNLFSLSGYARVDFRVDAAGKPWVLEINANPCISPDAGFFAACGRDGMEYDAMILAIARAAG